MITDAEEEEIRRLARSLLKRPGESLVKRALQLRKNAIRRRGKYGHVLRSEYNPHRWGRNPTPGLDIDRLECGDFVKTCHSDGSSSRRWREVVAVIRNEERGGVSCVRLASADGRGFVDKPRHLILRTRTRAEAMADLEVRPVQVAKAC